MKAIVNYSGDYVGYMLINGVAYAVAQGITLDNLVERGHEINSKCFGGSR